VLQETSDGCLVWEVHGDPQELQRDKIDFFSSLYLAQQAYPDATREALPSFVADDVTS
jgi:hypothetical protein